MRYFTLSCFIAPYCEPAIYSYLHNFVTTATPAFTIESGLVNAVLSRAKMCRYWLRIYWRSKSSPYNRPRRARGGV